MTSAKKNEERVMKQKIGYYFQQSRQESLL